MLDSCLNYFNLTINFQLIQKWGGEESLLQSQQQQQQQLLAARVRQSTSDSEVAGGPKDFNHDVNEESLLSQGRRKTDSAVYTPSLDPGRSFELT